MIDVTNPDTKRVAFEGGNIEWVNIPATGDVYDFGGFWAYHDGQKWFVACWSSVSATEAQAKLKKLANNTQKRLATNK